MTKIKHLINKLICLVVGHDYPEEWHSFYGLERKVCDRCYHCLYGDCLISTEALSKGIIGTISGITFMETNDVSVGDTLSLKEMKKAVNILRKNSISLHTKKDDII